MTVDDVYVRVVDALVEDLVTNAQIEPRTVVRYKRPLIVMPDECPLLSVSVGQKVPTGFPNMQQDSDISVAIIYWSPAVDQVKSLIDNPDWAADDLRTIGRIEARIRHLAFIGWDVYEAWSVLPGMSELIPPPEIAAGAVEGYAMTVVVSVTEGVE